MTIKTTLGQSIPGEDPMPSYFTKRSEVDPSVHITRGGSVFGLRPYTYNPETLGTKWELLTEYMKRRYISRNQVRTLIRRKWVAVSSFKNRLYISELCHDLIEERFSE
jgi:hypothetical protein